MVKKIEITENKLIELLISASKWGSWAYNSKERERQGKTKLSSIILSILIFGSVVCVNLSSNIFPITSFLHSLKSDNLVFSLLDGVPIEDCFIKDFSSEIILYKNHLRFITLSRTQLDKLVSLGYEQIF